MYRRAVDAGVIKGGEANRINFITAATAALRYGREPVKLFAWIVNGQHWDYLTRQC